MQPFSHHQQNPQKDGGFLSQLARSKKTSEQKGNRKEAEAERLNGFSGP